MEKTITITHVIPDWDWVTVADGDTIIYQGHSISNIALEQVLKYLGVKVVNAEAEDDTFGI